VLIKPKSSIQVDCQIDRDFCSKSSAIEAKIFRQISRTETRTTAVLYEQVAGTSTGSGRITANTEITQIWCIPELLKGGRPTTRDRV
jgi:hypothetical protein